jgi:hypothetical protein
MATATIPAAGTVSRSWETGLIITRADLTGIISGDPAATTDSAGNAARCSRPGPCPAWTCWKNSSSPQ